MTSHKFRVGQVVDFDPCQVWDSASTREYRILQLLAPNAGEQLYRIKTITEASVRVAKESELAFGPKEYGQVLKFCERVNGHSRQIESERI